MVPSVATEPPPGWIASEIARPTLGGGSGATLTQWSAVRSPASGETLLLACVATPIPGWVDDMRPSVEARTLSFASSSADRVAGIAVETRDEGGRLVLRPAGAGDDAPRVGLTRTFIGWTPSEVLTCFATCASPPGREPRTRRACDVSVDRARLEGGSAPPPPGIALGAVIWAVHHPSNTVLWGGLLTFFAGAVAVVSRRRPRSRI
jgi:hypothetical protein